MARNRQYWNVIGTPSSPSLSGMRTRVTNHQVHSNVGADDSQGIFVKIRVIGKSVGGCLVEDVSNCRVEIHRTSDGHLVLVERVALVEESSVSVLDDVFFRSIASEHGGFVGAVLPVGETRKRKHLLPLLPVLPPLARQMIEIDRIRTCEVCGD